MLRTRAVLTGPQIVGGGVQDFYWDAGTGSALVAATFHTEFWAALAPGLKSGNSATVESVAYVLDEATGDTIGILPVDPAPETVQFASAEQPLPTATQALVQWLTPGIVNNRRVRGRTFLPATVEGANETGVPNAAARAAWLAAANGIIGDVTTPLVVWSRPTESRPGSIHPVESASIWTQWASLRSRRD